MDLICYVHPAWRPLIRPALHTRAWMDATPEAFAYRCLPLTSCSDTARAIVLEAMREVDIHRP